MLPPVNDFSKLGAPIANVVICDNVVSEKAGHAYEAIPENRAANMANVHGFGDIGGAEIHDDFTWMGDERDAEAFVLRHSGDRAGEKRILQAEIDKARAGDLRRGGKTGDVELADDLGGDITRVGPFFLRKGHGGIRLIIPEARVGRLGYITTGWVEIRREKCGTHTRSEKFARCWHLRTGRAVFEDVQDCGCILGFAKFLAHGFVVKKFGNRSERSQVGLELILWNNKKHDQGNGLAVQ